VERDMVRDLYIPEQQEEYNLLSYRNCGTSPEIIRRWVQNKYKDKPIIKLWTLAQGGVTFKSPCD